jgi:hypothetical protein
MNTGSQALVIRNTLQESGQLPLLLFGKSCQQRLLMLTRDAANGLQSRSPRFGQVQSIAATVGLMRPTFQQSSGFQFIYERNQTARKCSERGCKCLLGDGRPTGQNSKDASMSGDQLQLRQTLREFRRRVSSYLRQ